MIPGLPCVHAGMFREYDDRMQYSSLARGLTLQHNCSVNPRLLLLKLRNMGFSSHGEGDD